MTEALAGRPRLGWLEGLVHRPSLHYDERPEGACIDLAIIHAISLPPDVFGGPQVLEFFEGRLNPEAHPYFAQIAHLRVAPHFFIDRDGRSTQCVSVLHRAWHAGVSCFQGRERCNDFSIGIELEGSDTQPFTDAQYDSLILLLHRLRQCCPLRHTAGHSDVAPGRKTDPGPFFEWARLHRAGF